MGAVILGLHLLGWGAVWQGATHGAPALVGLAGIAYVFGLRHAFDADHIAAIDNTTRRLMAGTRQPHGVGFYFSLGHSSVVLLTTLAVVVATQTATQRIPELREWGLVVGTTVSGLFLCAIGVINLVVMLDIVRAVRRMRAKADEPAAIEARLLQRGVVTRWFGGVFRLVTRPWQMYLVGFLFGLGFDTATEIGLLTTAAVATSQQMPIVYVLSLPVVFAAGMSLMDTADGLLMCRAYAWASGHPFRKIFYNVTITGLSAAVALFIGVTELVWVVSAKAGWTAGMSLTSWDSQALGYGVVVLFLLVWGASLSVWRLGKFEQP